MEKTKVKIEGGTKSPLFMFFEKKPRNFKPIFQELLSAMERQLMESEKEIFKRFDWKVTTRCQSVFRDLKLKFAESKVSLSELQSDMLRIVDFYIKEWERKQKIDQQRENKPNYWVPLNE